jgi:FkbM family methyltransferase
MLNLLELFARWSVLPLGVIQVGAHDGNEVTTYLALGANVLCVEANPTVYNRLVARVGHLEGVRTVQCAVGDHDGTATFRITSSDQSSSLLPLKKHSELYPQIVEIAQLQVPLYRLDTLLTHLQVDRTRYNILHMDIQGAELLALRGAEETLQYIDAISTEINYEELYDGCALITDMDRFLEVRGFTRVATVTPYDPSWGDALYVRRPRLTFATLGRLGRFGNQIFQYAYLKIYAKLHNLQVETPTWIGQTLFGHHDPPVIRNLPAIFEWEEVIGRYSGTFDFAGEPPLTNLDLRGYFQFPTRHYAPHKEYFRSLFEPTLALHAQLQPALARLRAGGRTIVGLHLRRGDYGYGYFFLAPNAWYRQWLELLWPTLDNPVLFIASDRADEVQGEFADFKPLIARDLGVEMEEADFYPDFYLLSQCDCVAISNSTFSFAACMLNQHGTIFMRPSLEANGLLPFDPWDSEPLLRGMEVLPSGEVAPRTISFSQEMLPPHDRYWANSFFRFLSDFSGIDSLATPLPCMLQQANVLFFPDWSSPQTLLQQLASVLLPFETLLQQLELKAAKTLLLIDTAGVQFSEAEQVIATVVENLILNAGLKLSGGLQIRPLPYLTAAQWRMLVPQLHASITSGAFGMSASYSAGTLLLRTLSLDPSDLSQSQI